MVKNQAQKRKLASLSPTEVVIGSFTNQADLNRACKDIKAIYHICPNVHPREIQIGIKILAAAKINNVHHFVYHSVMHPHVQAMPHHWKKMRVEELIFASNIPYTILQPTAYMQNILAYKESILKTNIYSVPYNTEANISLVDLNNIAEVVEIVVTSDKHYNAIYELANHENLSPKIIGELISIQLKKNISVTKLDINGWERNAIKGGMGKYQRTTLIKMFRYYNSYGLSANGTTLENLLGKPPTTFQEFLIKEF
jgi:NAD(P)H dehydrogenase (quinone)